MNDCFADLHVHVGRSGDGRPVKISAASNLTVEAVLHECRHRKGIDIVGLVDAGSPGVQADIRRLLDREDLEALPGGGLRHRNGTVLILGMEIEIGQDGDGPAHYVGYFPDLTSVTAAAEHLAPHVTNMQLSTQRARLPAAEWLAIVKEFDGLFMPAHVFTPHRGFYGACARRLPDVFGDSARHIRVVELGLSADSSMADRIDELGTRTFLSSSDAHSLSKIAREYTVLQLKTANFSEFVKAIHRVDGRSVGANYGLNPLLGKYHRSGCPKCGHIASEQPPVHTCSGCGHQRLVTGVLDRLTDIADRATPCTPVGRPPYIHQVPLQFIPGIGPKTLERLLDRFGTEMDVLHRTTREQLAEAVGDVIARRIVHSRDGKLTVRSGGGGVYGKVDGGT